MGKAAGKNKILFVQTKNVWSTAIDANSRDWTIGKKEKRNIYESELNDMIK